MEHVTVDRKVSFSATEGRGLSTQVPECSDSHVTPHTPKSCLKNILTPQAPMKGAHEAKGLHVQESKITALPIENHNVKDLVGDMLDRLCPGSSSHVHLADDHNYEDKPAPQGHYTRCNLQKLQGLQQEAHAKSNLGDFVQAVIALDKAWHILLDELQRSKAEHRRLAHDRECAAVWPQQSNKDSASLDNSRRASRECQHDSDYQEARRQQELLDFIKNETPLKFSLIMEMCSMNARTRNWHRVDELTATALGMFGPAVQYGAPDLTARKEEQRWTQLMIHRGVACAFLGHERYACARQCFEGVLRVDPRNRDARRGLKCVVFLETQVLTEEARAKALEALAGPC